MSRIKKETNDYCPRCKDGKLSIGVDTEIHDNGFELFIECSHCPDMDLVTFINIYAGIDICNSYEYFHPTVKKFFDRR